MDCYKRFTKRPLLNFAISLLLITACAPKLAPTNTPTPPEDTSKIAFASNRNGNYDIFTINPDGSDETQITTSKAEDLGGDFSPDGQFLVFWSFDGSVNPPANNMWFMRADGTDLVKLGLGAGKVSWSADGHQVIYNSIWEAGGNFDIISVNLEEKAVKRLTEDPESDTTPDWSPDGKTIAFTSYRDGTPHIYLMNADGSEQRRLTNSAMAELNPEWSPDGKMIAFWSGDPVGTTQVYLINSDGTGLKQLTDSPGLNDGAYFSPDGKKIVFSSRRTGNRELYLVNIDGTELVQLTHDPGEDLNPAWSSGGRTFTFE